MSLNRVQLIGNVTRDPELRQIPGGATVANFGIATNFSWTDASGQRHDKTEFHNLVAYRRLADICGQYVRKGSKLFAEGRLQSRDWEGKDGVKRTRTEVILDNMIMLDRKGAPTEGGASYAAREHGGVQDDVSSSPASFSPTVSSGVSGDNEPEIALDDLPF